MDVLFSRPIRSLLLVGAIALLGTHPAAHAALADASPAELISSTDLEQSYFAESYVLDDFSLEQSVADDFKPPALPVSAPPPVMISMRPSLWTGAVTMLLLIPVFGRFRRRLFI